MLLVDPRAGSQELVEPLRKLGLPVDDRTQLDYGDLAFMGRGEQGAPVFIGLEHKKVPDLLQSLTTERLQGHQLPGMIGVFDNFAGYDRRHLIIEGDWSHDPAGNVTLWKGRGKRKPAPGAPQAMELEKRLLVLSARFGVEIHRCSARRDTLRFIYALYRVWTDKDLDEHKSHLAMYAPDLDKGLFNPPTDFRKSLSVLLPGVETAVSKAVEDECGGPHVPTRVKLLKLLSWTEPQWAELMTVSKSGKARRLGASRARDIMEALDGKRA